MSHPTRTQSVLDVAELAESLPESSPLRFELGEILTEPALQAEMQTSADGLMAALFGDVDQMLEHGIIPTVEPESAPEAVLESAPEQSAEPVVPLAAILPPKLAPRDLMPQPDLPEEPPLPEEEEVAPVQKTGKTAFWLSLLCGSLLLTAGLLSYFYRTQVSQFWLHLLEEYGPEQRVSAPTASPSPSPENADFLQYLSRSMERLSQQAKLEPSPSPSPTVSPSPSAAPSVIERVYVPIYPTTPSPAPAAPTAPVPATRPAPAANRPAALAQPKPAPVAASPVPNIAAADSHALLGVLELGDRSAALFEVNGTPQRIEMGEPIGTSGWTLVSVSNQEAIVRRNGEVRSIYVGQKF